MREADEGRHDLSSSRQTPEPGSGVGQWLVLLLTERKPLITNEGLGNVRGWDDSSIAYEWQSIRNPYASVVVIARSLARGWRWWRNITPVGYEAMTTATKSPPPHFC
jgi:hypothetical protein